MVCKARKNMMEACRLARRVAIEEVKVDFSTGDERYDGKNFWFLEPCVTRPRRLFGSV